MEGHKLYSGLINCNICIHFNFLLILSRLQKLTESGHQPAKTSRHVMDISPYSQEKDDGEVSIIIVHILKP